MGINYRLQQLEKKEAQRATDVNEPLSDHFRVSTSCPPSTVLHIRGGNVWESSNWIGRGFGYYIEEYSVDFGDAEDIEEYTGNFSNAGYYIGVIFGRGYYGEAHCIGSGIEFASAGEAEADIENIALRMSPWFGVDEGALPLCGLVLRNNGITSTDGAILPIDRINRGRSYYWNDLRPRHYINIPGGPD
jgi:hypothetical protein